MPEVAVYRVDYGRKIKDPVGTVFEKRKTERSNNYLDLLWLARRLFALDSADALHIDRREACPGSNLPGSARKFRRDHFFSKAWRWSPVVGVVHHTRVEAEADNEHFDGKTTE